MQKYDKSPTKQASIDFPSVQSKKVSISYSGGNTSTEGGVLLLHEVDQQLGLVKSLSACINDQRDPRYVSHSVGSMLSQRIFQIAAGHQDANDCNALRGDAIMKLCCDKLPESAPDLGGQSTMSRFENSVSRSELYRMAKVFVDAFIASYQSEPSLIILDADDTNNNAYGNQLQIEFNQYYGEYVFMPLHIYEGLSGKLITTILKPGRRSKSVQVFAILRRIIEMLRAHWKNTQIIVRGDSHFHCAQLSSYCKQQPGLGFLTGLASNSILKQCSASTVATAEKQYKEQGRMVKLFHSFPYKAKSWEYEERIIVKVEVSEKGTNIRYIATNLTQYRARALYQIGYCARGAMELRIKEHKTYLKSDRTSCHRFQANQFRLFLHSAAYVLIHSLQKEVLRGTEFANSTMETIQLKLLKTAAQISELKTKVKVVFPANFAQRQVQRSAFELLGILNTKPT